MKSNLLKAIIVTGILCSGFSWSFQDQPKKSDEDMVSGGSEISSARKEAALVNIEKAKLNLAETDNLIPREGLAAGAEMGKLSSITKRVNSAASPGDGANNSAGAIAGKIDRLNRVQKLSRIPSADEMSVLEKASGAAADMREISGEINKIANLHRQIDSNTLNKLGRLHEVIQLTQAHEKILEELENFDEEKNEVTVVNEEEILKQEMLRLMNSDKGHPEEENPAAA